MKKATALSLLLLWMAFLFAGCTVEENKDETVPARPAAESDTVALSPENGFFTEKILYGEEGSIHYSYYLPKNYDEGGKYPLMVTMPGYDVVWGGLFRQ